MMLYLLAMHLLVLVALFRNKHRNFLKRLGFGFPRQRARVWIHAVSVGEVRALRSLVEQLEGPVLITTVTKTGFEAAKKLTDNVAYLPFDLPYIIGPIMRAVTPELVIVCETDFWGYLERAAKKVGARLVLVNGKISERSYGRLKKMPRLANRLLGPFDHLCVQSDHYRERFERVGVDPQKISVTGNLKLANREKVLTAEERVGWKKRLGLEQDDFVLTLGSTHDPEEGMLLEALEPLWEKFPRLKVVLVPRHPERTFGEMPARVSLVQEMGVLTALYQLSDLVFVGGSLTQKVGGHNIIEPAFFSVATLHGPHMHDQPNLVELAQKYHAAEMVPLENLCATLEKYIGESAEREKLVAGAGCLSQKVGESLERTKKVIVDLVGKEVLC